MGFHCGWCFSLQDLSQDYRACRQAGHCSYSGQFLPQRLGEYILINLFMQSNTTTMSSFIGAMMDAKDGKYLVSSGVLAAARFCYIIPVIIVFAISQKTLLQVKQGGSIQ